MILLIFITVIVCLLLYFLTKSDDLLFAPKPKAPVAQKPNLKPPNLKPPTKPPTLKPPTLKPPTRKPSTKPPTRKPNTRLGNEIVNLGPQKKMYKYLRMSTFSRMY